MHPVVSIRTIAANNALAIDAFLEFINDRTQCVGEAIPHFTHETSITRRLATSFHSIILTLLDWAARCFYRDGSCVGFGTAFLEIDTTLFPFSPRISALGELSVEEDDRETMRQRSIGGNRVLSDGIRSRIGGHQVAV